MQSSAWKLLLLLGALPLTAGCMPDSPETVFSWDVNDQVPIVRGHDARVYAYQDTRAAPPVPTPRPNPVIASAAPARPAPRPSFTQSLLAPVSPRDPDNAIAFAWPVTGPVIADFGSTGTGGRNDGINIDAPKDAPIRAAASGTVTYSGNELKDYGNLVLIKHAGGYVTAYAHADRLVVSRGDVVAKGQVIGYAGNTGDVSTPQLHFEIRHDAQPVNPKPLLLARNS